MRALETFLQKDKGIDAQSYIESFLDVAEAVPGLMDMGIDVLQALQFSAANMDPKHLKDTYGGELCFEEVCACKKCCPSAALKRSGKNAEG